MSFLLETQSFFQDLLKNEFIEVHSMSLRKFLAFNTFFSYRNKNKEIFEHIDPDAVFYIKNDFENLKKGTFRWEDIDIPSIEIRSNILKFVTETIPPAKLSILDTSAYENLFPVKFIDLITESPNYSFGESIYNKSLDFYTLLLQSFIKFHLLKDLQTFDKVNAENIQNYTPFARYYVQETNQKNYFIKEKYFNKDFNLAKFAVKLVTKFVPGATWRWIGAGHRCHIYSVEICKIIVEYGLCTEDELEEIKSILYVKIPVYQSLERVIDRDAANVSKEYIITWREGLIKVREYYAEILIHHLYSKQDRAVLVMLRNTYEENKRKNGRLSIRDLPNFIRFSTTVLFEEEFGRKMMEFLMGYIISQNTISGVLLVTKKINEIVGMFLYIISNVDDPYLMSLKLMREEDYSSFALINFEKTSQNYHELMTGKLFGFKKDLTNLLQKTTSGQYLYQEENVVYDLMIILDKLQEEIHFREFYNLKSLKNYEVQRALSSTNLTLYVFQIMTIYLAYNNYLETHEGYEQLFTKYSEFIQFYLLNNMENHCTFFSEEIIHSFELSCYKAPYNISSLMVAIFTQTSQTLIIEETIFDVLKEIFKKLNQSYFAKPEAEEFQALGKILEILALYLSFNQYKIFVWISEFDIRISMFFSIEPEFEEYFKVENFEQILRKKEDQREVHENNKLNTMMQFWKVMRLATSYRFVESVYKKITNVFTKEKMTELIELTDQNFEYRKIFLEIYCIFHIDLKNHLLDNRFEYYTTKPKDPQYNEDPFYDQEFNKTIDLFTLEIKHVLEYCDENQGKFDKNLIDYMNNGIFAGVVKLMNYFLVVREEDHSKLLKYVQEIEDFYNFMNLNRLRLLIIYGVNISKLSPSEKTEKDPLLSDIENINEKFKFKRDRMKIQSYSNAIFELCSELMTHKQLDPIKSEMLTRKSTISRIGFAIHQHNKLSPQMKDRQGTLDVSFVKYSKSKNANDKLKVLEFMVAEYTRYKMKKMSVDSERNIYISSLRNNSPEVGELTYNLCAFSFNFVKNEWPIDRKVKHFITIECIINTLFIATEAVQKKLLKVIADQSHNQSMIDNIWKELIFCLSFVTFKTSIDFFWKEYYRKLLILLKFYLFICEDRSVEFKSMMIDYKASPDDDEKKKRIDRWMNVFQKLCDTCQWHTNYKANEINLFTKQNRAHLALIGTAILDNLTEFCTGPHEEIQKALYVYPYDRYNGILHRYTDDPNSLFYNMKLSMVQYMLAMSEGMNEEIVNYHSTNFEMYNINKVIINSIRQLFYWKVKNVTAMHGNLAEYPLKYEDYKLIMREYENNTEFSNHVLMNIAIKLYSYIYQFAEYKSKYSIFLKERADSMPIYEKNHYIPIKSISEEDLMVFKFMSKILIGIEIARDKNKPLVSYYFPIQAKCFYLSDETKNNFINNIDRTSSEAKITGLLSNAKFFKYEMEYSQKWFKTLKFHEMFGSGRQIYFFEVWTFLLSCAINFILLVYFDSHQNVESQNFITKSKFILAFGIIEIILSLISIISFFYLNYPMKVKINERKYLAVYAYKTKLNIFDKLYVWIYETFLRENIFIFFYHILFVSLGLSISYLFLAIDFFSIANLFPTMRNIINSFTNHADQIGTTLVLAGVLMYSYSTFIHIYFTNQFSSDFPGNTYCSSLSHCFLTIIDKAFRNGEGIGGILTTAFYGESGGDPRFYGSLFLNLSFFLLINIVILNIILAILVDTFGQLRRHTDFFSKFFVYIF